jgi:glycosyltransferase involved in cell wall biosynthesis
MVDADLLPMLRMVARIAIDATSVSADGKGLSRVQRETVRALAALERHEVVAYVAEDVELEVTAVRATRRPALLWEQVGLRRAARDADVALTWTERLPVGADGRFVVWLFELPKRRIALNRAQRAGVYQLASDLVTELLWRPSLRRAARVLAASETTAAELRAALPELGEIIVVHPGVDPRFSPGRGRDGHYVFHLSSDDPRDNSATVAQAVRLANERLREPVRLIVAGGSGGRVSDEELVALYRGAAAYLDASLFEGFGYQPLEAMACDAPVVASTAAREVVGEAGLLCHPNDAQAQADALVRLLEEPGLAADLRRRGLERAADFSWDRTAAQLADVLDEVAS